MAYPFPNPSRLYASPLGLPGGPYPISSYPIEYAGVSSTNRGAKIDPAPQYSENLNPNYQPPQYWPVLPPLAASTALPANMTKPPLALNIPLQNYQNQGYNINFPNPLSHNPPYSPYGTQTKEDIAKSIMAGLPLGLSMSGGGDMYAPQNLAQNPQDQLVRQQIQNSLLGAEQMPIMADPITGQPTPATDANGNPIPATTTAGTQQAPKFTGYIKDPNQITRGSDMTARAAMGFNLATDASALLNNLIQTPPPTIQNPLTHLNRLDIDTSNFDQMQQQNSEQANASNRLMRESSSQMADVIRGTGATATNQAEAARQIAMSKNDVLNKQTEQNNALANQEQQIQNQENTQEQLTNYQIQAQAQKDKSAAITSNLTEMKKDVSQEAQYNIQNQRNMQQLAIDQNNKAVQAELDLLGIKYNIDSQYESNPDYVKGLADYKTTALNDAHTKVMSELAAAGDISFLQGKDWKAVSAEVSQIPTYVQNGNKAIADYNSVAPQLKSQLEKLQTEFEAVTTPAEKAAKDAEIQQVKADLAGLEEARKSGEMALKKADMLTKYQSAIKSNYNDNDATTKYSQQYRTNNGILQGQEFYKAAENLLRNPIINRK